MKDENLPLALLVVFVPFSLASIGGGTSILAGIHHQAVDVRHWITAREFVDMFAISRASPGPGSMLTTLIGWHVWGWTGAIVATLALYVPSSLIAYGAAMVWRRHRGKRWHSALEQGLAPVGVGLVMAGIVAVLQIGSGGWLAWVVAFGAAGFLYLRPRFHPLMLFVVGAAVFAAAHALALT